jgi:hypothetical protein
LLDTWAKPGNYEKQPKLNKDRYMYVFYDLNLISVMMKLEGSKDEVDDWNADITPYLVSQNVIMLMLLEIESKKRWLNKYVDELIGVRKVEEKLRTEVMARYPDLEPKPEKKVLFSGIRNFYGRVQNRMANIDERFGRYGTWLRLHGRFALKYFIRIGPYETVRSERLSKMYGRYMGGGMTDPLIKFIKTEVGKLSGVQPP